MQADCHYCGGKKVSIMVGAGQSRDQVKQDGKLEGDASYRRLQRRRSHFLHYTPARS